MTMRRHGRAGLGGVLLLTAALAGCAEGGPPRPSVVGDRAPDYAAVSLAGDSVSLDRLRGQAVLLNVWATWCEPCREEIPALQALHETHADEGLRVVGVSVDAPGEEAAVRDFAASYGVTYEVWLDPEERVSSTFRLIGVPSTFLVGPEGKILWKHVGPVRTDDPALQRALREALPRAGDRSHS